MTTATAARPPATRRPAPPITHLGKALAVVGTLALRREIDAARSTTVLCEVGRQFSDRPGFAETNEATRRARDALMERYSAAMARLRARPGLGEISVTGQPLPASRHRNPKPRRTITMADDPIYPGYEPVVAVERPQPTAPPDPHAHTGDVVTAQVANSGLDGVTPVRYEHDRHETLGHTQSDAPRRPGDDVVAVEQVGMPVATPGLVLSDTVVPPGTSIPATMGAHAHVEHGHVASDRLAEQVDPTDPNRTDADVQLPPDPAATIEFEPTTAEPALPPGTFASDRVSTS